MSGDKLAALAARVACLESWCRRRGGGGGGGGGGTIGLGGPPSTIAVGDAPFDGVSVLASHSDHVHGLPAPQVVTVTTGFAGTPGISTVPAVEDHAHAMAVIVQSSGALAGSEAILNFVPGAALLVTDEPLNNRVTITIPLQVLPAAVQAEAPQPVTTEQSLLTMNILVAGRWVIWWNTEATAITGVAAIVRVTVGGVEQAIARSTLLTPQTLSGVIVIVTPGGATIDIRGSAASGVLPVSFRRTRLVLTEAT